MAIEGQSERSEGSSSVSELPAFEPSENQLSLLGAYQSVDYLITKADACGKAGITTRAFRYWMEGLDFRRWWIGEIEKHFISALPAVYAAIIKVAKGGGTLGAKGQAAMAKLVLERFDKLYRPKEIVEHTGAMSIDEYLKMMSRKELEREAGAVQPVPEDRP